MSCYSAKQVLNEFSNKLGLDELVFDTQGLCQLSVDSKFAVLLRDCTQTRRMSLIVEIGLLSSSEQATKEWIISNSINALMSDALYFCWDTEIGCIGFVHLDFEGLSLQSLLDKFALLLSELESLASVGFEFSDGQPI